MSRRSPLWAWLRTACPPPARGRGKASHLPLRDPPRKPDPAIYSQAAVAASGAIPTWSSPDLLNLHVGPAGQDSGDPASDWTRVLIVRARNLGEVSATNVAVRAAWSEFGIGMPRTALPSRLISIPAGGTASTGIDLPPHDLDEPYGWHVWLEHPHDRDAGNNHGSQVIRKVRTSQQGRRMPLVIQARNPTDTPLHMTFSRTASDGLGISTPSEAGLAPGEEATLWVLLQVDEGLHGTPQHPVRLEATLMARAPGFLDGATWEVIVDD